jgi:flagellar biosynthesis protein FlhA
MAQPKQKNIFARIFTKDLITVSFFIAILMIILVPLPKEVLDFFLIVSLSMSLLILLISLYIQKPSDLTTFPTLILILALFRLALNIATTRSILGEGHNGPEVVSSIITAFGEFVVGGNMVLGIIVFIILVLINFMVITKGATRVAEVTARFTLDSLPGKQMAIDADLNAGFIDENQARQRRAQLISESGFYGSMDGAGKFVKGDAVAGIIITLINLIGGLLIGVFQHDLSVGESGEIYTILTIGDGLVAQIPALILSTATAIIITRSSNDEDRFASNIVNQLIQEHKALIIVGLSLMGIGLIPGFPTGILFIMGSLLSIIGYTMQSIESKEENLFTKLFSAKKEPPPAPTQEELKKKKAGQKPKQNEDKTLQNILKPEIFELKLGVGLLKMLQNDAELLDKIKGIRRTIVKEMGFIAPKIKISDESDLANNEYQLLLKRIKVANGKLEVGKMLAMGGLGNQQIDGIKVKEPVFELDAVWINEDLKDEALMKGFTVVDAETILSTHISEIIKQYASDILTRQDIVSLIDSLKADYPIVVEEALKVISYGGILKVCKELLKEDIPIVDMLTIIETLADIGDYIKNIDILLEQVRARLYRLITQKYTENDGSVHLITIKSELEQKYLSIVQENPNLETLNLEMNDINSLVTQTRDAIELMSNNGITKYAVISDPLIRRKLYDIYERFGSSVPVLSHAELDSKANFVIEATIE